MEIKQIPILDLIPYQKNARTHSEAQVAQIAASITEFGFTNPVLLDGNNGIIAGHGRVLAAQKLGILTVPCIELAHLTPTQKKAYILADNKIALNAGWDDELLRLELGELEELGFEIDLTGFNLFEMANIFDNRLIKEPESSAKEINTDDYQMGCTCPRCGFEFDNKNA